MEKIAIERDALPILRSGLEIQRKLLRQSSEKYKRQLEKFEKKYKMKTSQFLRRFQAGKLGDDPQWFDWLFAYKAYRHSREKFKIATKISL